MESFPFSQSVKERSVIKLHLCHRRLRCLPMHPILFRCISVLALPHGMAVLLFLSLKSVGYDVVMFPTARPILYYASADFPNLFS